MEYLQKDRYSAKAINSMNMSIQYLKQNDEGTEAEAASLDSPSWSGIKCGV